MSHKNISISRGFVLKTFFNLQKLVINLRFSTNKVSRKQESNGQEYHDRSPREGETWVDPGE